MKERKSIEVLPLNPLQVLTVPQLAKVTGLDRHIIAAAMQTWETTHGRAGLRFIRVGKVGGRRCACSKSVQSWFDQMERMTASGF